MVLMCALLTVGAVRGAKGYFSGADDLEIHEILTTVESEKTESEELWRQLGGLNLESAPMSSRHFRFLRQPRQRDIT